jgi:hypothetical protein
VGFGRFADAHPLLFSEIHRRVHEIALGELDAAMAQDVIRRCAVEIEIRRDEILQQPVPRKFALVGAKLDGDILVLRAVDLGRLEGFTREFLIASCIASMKLEPSGMS